MPGLILPGQRMIAAVRIEPSVTSSHFADQRRVNGMPMMSMKTDASAPLSGISPCGILTA
jgi:hypothetical protein